MLRYDPPFNGKRYLLNKNTGEIHDLENETDLCRIDDIRPEHIYTDTSYMNCLIRATVKGCPKPNGCFYCLPEKDNG